MAGKKQQAPAKFEEPDEAETWEDGEVAASDKEPEADLRLRDWRDVERYREIKELRQLVDEDDYAALEALFPKPVRNADPRATGRPRKAAKAAAPKPAAVKPGAPVVAGKGAAPAAKAVAPVKGVSAAVKPAAPVKGTAAKAAPAAAAKPAAKGLLAKMVAKLTKPSKPAAKKPVAKKPAPKAKAKAKPASKPKAKKKR